MDIDRPHQFPVELSSEKSESIPADVTSPSTIEKLSQAAELMRSFRLAQSLTQLILALTQTLPTILDACGCGYLTWVQSPRLGVRWESVTGDMGKMMEMADWGIDNTLSGIIRSKKHRIFTLPDKNVPKDITALMRQSACASLLMLPVNLEGDIRGTLMVGRGSEKPSWVENEALAGKEMVEMAVSMYTTRNNLLKAEQHIRELERVFMASLDLSANLDPDDVLNSILKNSLTLIPNSNDAHIFYYDGKALSFAAALFQDGSSGQVWSIPRNEGLTYNVARTGETIVIEDMKNHPLFKDAPESWEGAIVGMPLKMKGNVIGVMTVALLVPYTFEDASLRQLRLLADQAGIALQNARLHNLIREESQTDWLTGLPNRRAFEMTISQLIEQAQVLGGGFTLMMLDLDHFKSINDTYGHRIGDDALKRIALRLKESVRKSDLLARLGGDEFAIIFPNTKLEDAYSIGLKLQQHVAGCDLKLPDGKLGCVSVSLGMANYPQSGKTAEELLEAADSGLYSYKNHG